MFPGMWSGLLFMFSCGGVFGFGFKSFCVLAEFLFMGLVTARGKLISHCDYRFVCVPL